MVTVQNYCVEETEGSLCTNILDDSAILSGDPVSWACKLTKNLENNISSFFEKVVSTADKPDWLVAVEYDLQKLKKLPFNWDSYGSPPVFDELINDAKCFLHGLEMQDIATPFVAPLPDGGVHLEWRYNQRELEVEFSNKGNVEYLKVIDGEPNDEGGFKVNDYNKGRQLISWLLS